MTHTTKILTNVKITYMGVDHEQYFPGAGVAQTPFTHVWVGQGDSPAGALDDALDTYHDEDFVSQRLSDDMTRMVRADAEGRRLLALRTTDPEIDGWYGNDGNGDEVCPLHCYVALYATIEDRAMVVRLDNGNRGEGGDWERWGRVVVYTDRESADEDQSIDGSTWEIPGDLEVAYTILTDRPTLVAELTAEGYDLDLSGYEPPTEHDMARWTEVANAENDGAHNGTVDAIIRKYRDME
jgi:hypothetical protein